MSLRRITAASFFHIVASSLLLVPLLQAQRPAQTGAHSSPSSSSSSRADARRQPTENSRLDAGSVSDGVYRNKELGLTCKIPAGWVLRTEEMNEREEDETAAPARDAETKRANPGSVAQAKGGRAAQTAEGGCLHMCAKVLLAAFSRPPEAAGEDVNSSILIAAESVAAYPGLKGAVQYFGPVTEIAKGQGFAVVEAPYEFVVGTKKLVRGDFQNDVGSRVMRQSTLVMLARGYAVSFTFIGGTEDDVDELISGLSFGLRGKSVP